MRLSPSAHLDTFCRDHLPPPDQWPEFRFDLPELNYPERLNCAAELLDDGVSVRAWLLWGAHPLSRAARTAAPAIRLSAIGARASACCETIGKTPSPNGRVYLDRLRSGRAVAGE